MAVAQTAGVGLIDEITVRGDGFSWHSHQAIKKLTARRRCP